ncbi:MAG: hypothetical protein ABIJ21_07705 [Nanoarchaeota archaeon]
MDVMFTWVLVLGIFVVTAFFSISLILQRKQLGVGYWPLLASAVLFLIFGAYAQRILENNLAFSYFLLVAMIIFAFVAFLKFWEIMRLIE